MQGVFSFSMFIIRKGSQRQVLSVFGDICRFACIALSLACITVFTPKPTVIRFFSLVSDLSEDNHCTIHMKWRHNTYEFYFGRGKYRRRGH